MTITEYKAQLERYRGKTKTPEDFSAFWKERWDRLEGSVTAEPAPFHNPLAVYGTLTVAFPGGSLTARCILPRKEGRHPLVLQFHDLNRGPRGWHHMTRFIAQGYAVVALESGSDGADWKTGKIDFEERYLAALRLAKACQSLPFVDSSRIVTWGEGFGGALAIVTAAFLPARCAALNPFPADFRGVCGGLPEGLLEKLDYLDAVNFAPRLQRPFLLGTSLMDETAPPEGQYALYNRAACEKQHFIYPKYAHERINFFENELLKFLHD